MEESGRDRLLHAAIELFTLKGYQGVSIDAVADAAGVSRSTLFWHFRNKRQLLWEVVDHVTTELWETLVHSVADAYGIEAVRMFVTNRTPYLNTEGVSIRLVYLLIGEAIGYDPEVAAKLRIFQQRVAAQILQWFRDAQAAGQLRAGVDPEAAAIVIFSALHGINLQWLLAPNDYDIEAADNALRSALSLICKDSALGSNRRAPSTAPGRSKRR